MDGVVEIITGRERRRRWSTEEKLRLVAEMQDPGARVRAVAARHGVCESLLFTWRRQANEGVLVAPEMPVFMPVQMVETPRAITGPSRPEAAPPPAPAGRPQASLIEIDLGNGSHVRVGSDVNLAAPPARADRVARVIPVPAGVRVWLAVGATDMRKGMNGLAVQVQQALERDPHAGDLYVFRGRKADPVKILWHDGLGMSLYAKRLERGRFIWPQAKEGVVALTPATLSMLLEGIDWRNPQRTWRPELAG